MGCIVHVDVNCAGIKQTTVAYKCCVDHCVLVTSPSIRLYDILGGITSPWGLTPWVVPLSCKETKSTRNVSF